MAMQALQLSRRCTAEAAEAADLERKVSVADMPGAVGGSAGCAPATLLVAEPYFRACEQQLPWAHLLCVAPCARLKRFLLSANRLSKLGIPC